VAAAREKTIVEQVVARKSVEEAALSLRMLGAELDEFMKPQDESSPKESRRPGFTGVGMFASRAPERIRQRWT
jgi:hypothetical protein